MTSKLRIISKRPDGTQTYIEYNADPSGDWSASEEEAAEMLLEAEMYGNSSLSVRVDLGVNPVRF